MTLSRTHQTGRRNKSAMRSRLVVEVFGRSLPFNIKDVKADRQADEREAKGSRYWSKANSKARALQYLKERETKIERVY